MSIHPATAARRDRPSRTARRRARAGMTLMEVLVAVAILLILTAAVVPSMSALLDLEQRGAARKLALTFEQLQNEAVLRNVTFRVGFNLDEGSWHVEAGDPRALAFSSAAARAEFEERKEEVLERMDAHERREYAQRETFQKVGKDLGGPFKLPPNTEFASVYTPQYANPVTKRGRRSNDEKGPRVAYSYVFSNGFAEYTVVQLVDVDDPETGFTVTVDPMSGRVQFHSELVDHHDQWSWLPDEGPSLDL